MNINSDKDPLSTMVAALRQVPARLFDNRGRIFQPAGFIETLLPGFDATAREAKMTVRGIGVHVPWNEGPSRETSDVRAMTFYLVHDGRIGYTVAIPYRLGSSGSLEVLEPSCTSGAWLA